MPAGASSSVLSRIDSFLNRKLARSSAAAAAAAASAAAVAAVESATPVRAPLPAAASTVAGAALLASAVDTKLHVTGPTFHALQPSPRLRELRSALALDSSPRPPTRAPESVGSSQPLAVAAPALTIVTDPEPNTSVSSISSLQSHSKGAHAAYPDLGSPTSVVAAAAAVAAVAPAELRVLAFATRSLRDALASMDATESARGELADALEESQHGMARNCTL